MRVRLFAAEPGGELEEIDAGGLDVAGLVETLRAEVEAASLVAAVRACVWRGEAGGYAGAVA